MTYDELKALVCRAYEPAEHMMRSAMFLPRVMSYAAKSFWVEQTPETDDMQEIRRQLKFLEEHGHFDLEK